MKETESEMKENGVMDIDVEEYKKTDPMIRAETEGEYEHRMEREVKDKYIKNKKLREKITALSVKCVAFEGTAIYCTALALCWYLNQWGHVCDYGCIRD